MRPPYAQSSVDYSPKTKYPNVIRLTWGEQGFCSSPSPPGTGWTNWIGGIAHTHTPHAVGAPNGPSASLRHEMVGGLFVSYATIFSHGLIKSLITSTALVDKMWGLYHDWASGLHLSQPAGDLN
jgi:hypothetical protein